MPGIIRLEWFRSKGYRLVEQWGPHNVGAHDKEWRERWNHPTAFPCDRYPKPETWLVPKAPPAEAQPTNYVIEGVDHRVYLELANAANEPRTVERALAFLARWGSPHPHPCGEIAVRIFYDIADYMREAVELAQDDPIEASKFMDLQQWAPRIGIQLAPRFGRLRGDAAPRLYLDAVDLLGFCQAELMQALAGGTEIRPCGNCGTLIALGKVGHPPRYCSDRCRIAMHRKVKREREKKRVPRPGPPRAKSDISDKSYKSKG